MTGYEAFCLYHALKLHFTTKNYDYIKYFGKTNLTFNSFKKCSDRFKYHKLAKKYPKKQELEKFLIANFGLRDGVKWIGNLFEEDAEDAYTEYRKIRESFTYIFKKECVFIFENSESLNSSIIFKNNEHPDLIKFLLNGDVNYISFIVLDKTLSLFKYWNKFLANDPIYDGIKFKCEKLMPFVNVDIVKAKNTLKEVIDDYKQLIS